MVRWFVIVALLSSAILPAQNTITVSLEDAIDLAIRNNRQLDIARLEMQKADAQVKEAYGYAMPTVNFDGTYTRALKLPVIFLPDFADPESGKITPVKFGADNSYQLGFTARQVIFNAIVFTGVGTAKIYQRTSRELYRAAYNNAIANVKRAFYNVLMTRQVYETTQASMANAEESFKNIEILHRQEIVSDYDLVRAEVQVENIRPMVIEAEDRVLVTTNALKVSLGIDVETPIAIRGTLELITVDSMMLEPAHLIGNNAALQVIDGQRQLMNEVVAIRQSEYMPTLTAFGNYQWSAQKNAMGLGGKDLIASSQAGITLSINLFSGLQTMSRIQQATVDRRKAEQQMHDTREMLRTQLQSVALRLEEARKRIQSQERTVGLAEKSYRIARTRYQTGSGTQLELNDGDLALMRARLNRIQAIYDYNLAKADLEELISYHHPR